LPTTTELGFGVLIMYLWLSLSKWKTFHIWHWRRGITSCTKVKFDDIHGI